MTYAPDPRADGISINDYCATLPRRRYSHLAQGMILLLPRTGLVVVPFREHPGGWDVVVVEGHGAYPVGGYNLSISDTEIETAIELAAGGILPVQLVATVEDAEALKDGLHVLTRTHGGLAKATVDGETRWARSAFNKVSITTAELAAELPLAVVDYRPTTPQLKPAADPLSGGRPAYVHTPEEADALPDAESILTPGGIVFRKSIGYYREGETTWHRFMHVPITTHLLDEKVHFPAKVLGTTDADTPDWNEASRV